MKVAGELTLHGGMRPDELAHTGFRCLARRVVQREDCGTAALARFDRSDFGCDVGKDYGWRSEVTLRIQAEAVADR